MKSLKARLVVTAMLTVSCTAHAALFSIDYLTPGDGLITYDDISGLEWLDLTMTQGRSYADVSSQLGQGGDFAGWGVSSWAQAKNLFGSVGVLEGPDSYWANFYQPTTNPQQAATGFALLKDLMGFQLRGGAPAPNAFGPDEAHLYLDGPKVEDPTWATYYEVKPFYENGSVIDAMISPQNSEDTIYAVGPYRSTLLVRQVSNAPVPAAAWLFGSGLLGLTGLMCKRKAA